MSNLADPDPANKEGVAKGPEGPIFEPAVLLSYLCTGPLLGPNLGPSGPFATPSKSWEVGKRIISYSLRDQMILFGPGSRKNAHLSLSNRGI